jgi:hypothetical protein
MRALAALFALSTVLLGCPSTLVGVACQKHDDCKGLKDGYCARAEICTRECSSSAPCPDTTTCVDQGRRVCLTTCTDDAGCLTGFSCQTVADADAGVCLLTHPLDPIAK